MAECPSTGQACHTTHFCKTNVWSNSVCFDGYCVDMSVDMHPICIGKCTAVQMTTVFDILIVDVCLFLFW